jgi:6-pyruvoyltetrahydropterin/6-carboxytetrahydropterin synthase
MRLFNSLKKIYITQPQPLKKSNRKVAVFRKEHFNCAHRLHSPHLSEEENLRVFGKCNSPHYHGHNYELIVKVSGEVDPVTGYVIDTKILSNLIKDLVIEKFDHRNLNLDTEEFRELNPTAENIAMVIHDLLRPNLEEKFELKVILYETERNFVEFPC